MVNKCLKIISLSIVLLFCGAFLSPRAVAQGSAAEQAISRTHKDPQLKWNPCPPIFPKGCEVTVLAWRSGQWPLRRVSQDTGQIQPSAPFAHLP